MERTRWRPRPAAEAQRAAPSPKAGKGAARVRARSGVPRRPRATRVRAPVTSGDWAGHSHTQCPKWPQKEKTPRRRGVGSDSDEPAPPTPRGAGVPPRGNRGGRSQYGRTVPARCETGVPGATMPRPRPTPVRMGYISGRPPHAGCCCHNDAGGRLSTGSTGASSSDPCSGGATDAARTAAHSARSASVP